MREKEFLPLVREKLGIEELNPMQLKMMQAHSESRDIILLSPTGSGKTLAFILPMLKMLRPSTGRVQAVVVAPSRELVIQIAGIVGKIAAGLKTTPLYGGHKVEDEVILTSATRADILPDFLKLDNPLTLDFLEDNEKLRNRIRVHRVDSDANDKLDSLLILLQNLSAEGHPDRSIIFVNHRESAERVANFLKGKGLPAVLYHGALDQREREQAVARFNNGSRPVLVATDLAARGLDIKNVRNIIHYHQPLTPETWTHRNGRTARVDADGDIFVLVGPNEDIKDYVAFDDSRYLDQEKAPGLAALSETIFFSAGRREKLSKGDILGFLVKEGGIEPQQIGVIDVFDHYALAAVDRQQAPMLMERVKGKKIKGEKRMISLLD